MTKNRAEQILEEFRRTHTDWYAKAEASAPERAAESEAARQAWITDGLLVPADELAQAWDCSVQALEDACKRDELFRLKINDRYWYPTVFTRLARADVARVNRALAGGDAVSKLIWWSRNHGGIGARPIEWAVQSDNVARAEEMARGLAEESGWCQVAKPSRPAS